LLQIHGCIYLHSLIRSELGKMLYSVKYCVTFVQGYRNCRQSTACIRLPIGAMPMSPSSIAERSDKIYGYRREAARCFVPLYCFNSTISRAQCFLLVISASDLPLTRIFAYPTCIRSHRYGGPRQNIATTFGVKKLDWCDYPTVKKN